MKVAVYIEEGLHQLVLTPDSEFETALLKLLAEPGLEHHIYSGEFYACQGGWTRHGSGQDSIIIVLEKAKK